MRKTVFRTFLLSALLTALIITPKYLHAEAQQFFQLDLENTYTDYNELNLGNAQFSPYLPLKSHEYGYIPGFHAGYIYQDPNRDLDFRLNLSYSSGSYTYDGTIASTGAPCTGTSSAKLFDVNFLTNLYTYNPANLSLYSGVGYHSWKRGVCSVSEPPGFQENYSWGYIPVGLRTAIPVGNDFSLEPDLSIRLMFAGTMDMPDYGQSVNLGNRFGADLRVSCLYHFDNTFSGVVTPWIDYSEIGKSNVVSVPGYNVWEPDSRTWQAGINIGLRMAI